MQTWMNVSPTRASTVNASTLTEVIGAAVWKVSKPLETFAWVYINYRRNSFNFLR
jgi:hypothetical protein